MVFEENMENIWANLKDCCFGFLIGFVILADAELKLRGNNLLMI